MTNPALAGPALTWPIVGLVLLGALLHASWNAIVKSSTDKALDAAVMHAAASLLALPVLAFAGLPPPAAWPYIGASVLIHAAYYYTLTGAYRHGELGLTYPIMRGSAPLLVALAAGWVLSEPLSAFGWAGVFAICAGVLALGFSRAALQSPHAIGYALANAGVIALYTLVDGSGVRVAGDALQYVAALFALEAWPFALVIFARRGGRVVGRYALQRWPFALAGAAASVLSYGIALWAMTRAPVALVAALRETSVLFAALLGTWLLKERFSLRRAAGTLSILGGVLALRLA